MKKYFLLVVLISFISCETKETADLLVKNASVYTVNESFDVVSAFVIKDGKILEVGNTSDLEKKYVITEILDVKGKTIVPGLIDAHAHLYNLGKFLQRVDLFGTKSFDEVLERIVAFQKEKNVDFILGRGWDQNDWEVKEFPSNERLDELFPTTPVVIRRVDGHAILANTIALKMARITSETKVLGGEIILKDGKLTGILIDNAMGLIGAVTPDLTIKEKVRALKEAERICLDLGLTTVSDAGLPRETIELIDSLQKAGEMSLRVYAMISNYKENLDYYLKKGKIKTERLNVRSVKVYADGALGSRGAAMKEPYSDREGHYGAMITPMEELESLASRIAEAGYQMNTHAIGDSAVVSVLNAYAKVNLENENGRWRIEHAQIVTPKDNFMFSKNMIPSVQPTHATSDMYWAEDRVGSERIKGAYAYKTLLDRAGLIALGTDFPIEKVNPMLTFYAAVARKDLNNYPEGGFNMDEALTREEALRGMTIWAAYANFEEHEKGSIEVGKYADFVILNSDLMTTAMRVLPNVKVEATYINGVKVSEK
ncbi:MAG: putative amidohydrolase YtcJ [Flavobacteriaceae bacterium]|jgi:predicted amidohydrolase YtcJ|uniref:amidohydrolase n=1 Tax=Candidatus Marifrigoribacter sp. Uisw_064 TaxID=3230970 RepID=UPI003AD99A1D